MVSRRNKKGKNPTDYGNKDLFNFYKKNYKNPIEESDYRRIIGQFNEEIAKLILEHAFEYRMPHRLGYVRIKKKSVILILDRDGKLKKNYLKVDWNATKQLWAENTQAAAEKKLIYHTNKHTDGYYFKWFWDKSATNVRNISVYKLIPSRKNLRTITHLVRTKEELDYYA